jgi:hypothetical protein
MRKTRKRAHEGVTRDDAGKSDREGFIAPAIGELEHALYFTTAPSVTEKTKQVLDQGRLLLPGVVVVWDETIGRRKGAKAVPNSWWADGGSLTAAFAFPPNAISKAPRHVARAANVVVDTIESFRPAARVFFRPPNDMFIGDKKLGAISFNEHACADILIVRLNCNTELSKAPRHIAASACRLIEFIDIRRLPLQKAGTLQNTLLTRLMSEIPKAFGDDILCL